MLSLGELLAGSSHGDFTRWVEKTLRHRTGFLNWTKSPCGSLLWIHFDPRAYEVATGSPTPHIGWSAGLGIMDSNGFHQGAQLLRTQASRLRESLSARQAREGSMKAAYTNIEAEQEKQVYAEEILSMRSRIVRRTPT